MSYLTDPIFTDPEKAREHLENIRWPHGPVCPHCGEADNIHKLKGKSTRPGVYKCRECRKPFTVTVGSIFEGSHVPLNKWVAAYHLMSASKKGMSAHQLHRMLGVTYKTAWFMAHRIRETMKDDDPNPMGGPGGSVQADETYIGRKDSVRGKPENERKGISKKCSVVSLISDGKSRTFHVKRADARTVRRLLVTNVSRDTELHTDESSLYVGVGREFKDHKTVVHARGRYVGPSGESTNKVENYFSIFKRGMRGVYQHCKEKHLQRYVDEFDFRYNSRDVTDAERRDMALENAEGRRLTYQQPVG